MVDVAELGVSVVKFGVLTLPGLFLLWIGYVSYRTRKKVEAMEVADPATVSPGLTKVTGSARPIDSVGTVATPLTGTESLAYEFNVSEFHPDADYDNWRPIKTDEERRRFRLEGTVEDLVVDPAGLDFLLEDSREIVVSDRDDLPPAIQSYVDEHGEDLFATRKTKIIERRIEPGENVYVLGQAEQSVPDDPTVGTRTRIRQGSDFGILPWSRVPGAISDQSESLVFALAKQEAWTTFFIIFGVLWLLFSLLFVGMRTI